MLCFSRERGTVRPGAHRMQRLLDGLGFGPIAPAPVVLVTGTNGKGTVCTFLEAAFRSAGFCTGLYTSPHLVSVEERVRVQGIPVSHTDFQEAIAFVKNAQSEHLPDASEFEILTAAAAVVFRNRNVDVAVVEIGLGGKLDSTNSFAPSVSVLTSVGLDHLEFLGSSEFDIAFDKSFISRRNRPIILGPLSNSAREGAMKALNVTGALVLDSQVLPGPWEEICQAVLSLGSFWIRANAENLRVALAALAAFEAAEQRELKSENMVDALRCATWPGRFDVRLVRNRTIIFDGAHNTQGFDFFLRQFFSSPWSSQKPVVVYASFSDKNWRNILPGVARLASALVLTQVNSERAVSCGALAEHVASTNAHSVDIFVEPAVTSSLERAFALFPNAPIMVVGSLALVGEAMETLGLDPFEALQQNRRSDL